MAKTSTTGIHTANAGVAEIDRMPVKIAHLDTLLGLTGEIIIAAANIAIIQRHLTTAAAPVDTETAEMVKQAALSTGRISSELHRLVMDIRMVPVRETFLRFRRLVRDLTKKQGKQVNFEILGEDTLVDKSVAERLYEPLAHQIRNAIDHGIEDPLDRQAVGKSPVGSLTLAAEKKDGFTIVSVTDDGRGMDLAFIRQTAIQRKLLAPDANPGEMETLRLILEPGFSTAREATEISGRGVGMDVVKSMVESMGGEVLIESTAGKGSRFTYRIPQLSAVNITDAVIIRAGSGFFAVPVVNVVATQSIKQEDIHTTMGRRENILYLGSILPLYDLLQLLTGTPAPAAEDSRDIPVIIIEAKNGKIACKVSEFIRPQKLVLIPLPEGFTAVGIAGTTILGGNQLGMILDPAALVGMATGNEIPSEKIPTLVGQERDGAPLPDRSAGTAPSGSGARDEAARADDAGIPQNEELTEQFFVEIADILKNLNEDIFQLEKAPADKARVNTIFRHFHSIKGNFMMTGSTSVGAFVHDVESVLDQVRENTLEVNQEIIDLLLDSVTILEEALAAIQKDGTFSVADHDLLTVLARYRKRETPATVTEDDGVFRFSPLGNMLFHAKMADAGVRVYQSMVHLRPTFQDPSLMAYLILKRLTAVVDIIDSAPSLERIEQGIVQDRLKVLFATTLSGPELDRFFVNQLQRYYSVASFENLLME